MSSSSSAPDLGDAVRPDGTLKHASEINWAFDADESIPFPAGQNAGDHTASLGSHAPDVMGDSICRTTRLCCPSRCVLDALDAEAACPRPRTTKRKPPQDIPSRRVSRKVVIDVDDDDGNDAGDSDNDDDDDSDGDSDNGIATEPASEAMSEEYDTLRAMADADNQVCPSTAPTFVRNPHLCYLSGCNFQIEGGTHSRHTPHVCPSERLSPSRYRKAPGWALVYDLLVSILGFLILILLTNYVKG